MKEQFNLISNARWRGLLNGHDSIIGSRHSVCVLCLSTSEEVCIRRLEALRGPPQQLLVQGPDPVVPVLVVQPTEEEAVVTHLEPNTQEQGIIQLPKHNTKRTHTNAHARAHAHTH